MTTEKHPLSGKIDSPEKLCIALRAMHKRPIREVHRWKYSTMRKSPQYGKITDETYHLWRDELRVYTGYWTHIKVPVSCVEQHETLHVSNHDGQVFVAFAESEEKQKRDIFTRMRYGKYLTKYYPEMDNEEVKRLVAEFEYKYGTPPEVKFGETPEDFVHAIKDGPSDSCQADSFYSGDRFHFRGHAHPAICYASGDIQAAWIEDSSGRVTARALINKEKKYHSRPYGDTERIDRQLADLGYEKRVNALVGCRLLCIENQARDGWLMPYVDAGTASGGGSLHAYRTSDKYWMLNNDGEGIDTYCGYESKGVTIVDEKEEEEPEYGHCDNCGDALWSEDDYAYSEHEGVSYCTECVDRRWTYAIVSVGRGRNNFNFDYVNNCNVTYIDCINEHVWDDIVCNLDVIKDEYRDEYIHLDDAVRSVWDDADYHRDDCVEVGQIDGDTVYLHEEDLKNKNLEGKIYYDEDDQPFWYESDEIREWLAAGDELEKYVLRTPTVEVEVVKVEVVKETIHVDHSEVEYKELIERVRRIDPAAAEYLDGDARRLPSFKPHKDLISVMGWMYTPQGHTYWGDIDNKLLEPETWQMTYRWMQSQGVVFDFKSAFPDWAQFSCGFGTDASPSDYRIRPNQPEPPNWRETFLEAQRRGVKFTLCGVFNTGELLFQPYPMKDYAIKVEDATQEITAVIETTQERMAA